MPAPVPSLGVLAVIGMAMAVLVTLLALRWLAHPDYSRQEPHG